METTAVPTLTTAPAGAVKLRRLFLAINPPARRRNASAVMALLVELSLRPGADIATLAKATRQPVISTHNHLAVLVRAGYAVPVKKQDRQPRTSILKSYPVLTEKGRAAVATLAAIVA